jgi:hypothetical protein
MGVLRLESVQGLPKSEKNNKTAAPAPVSRGLLTEYPDQKRFFNIFSATS